MCAHAVVLSRARQEKASRTDGLHIESSHSSSKAVVYPEGLDEERTRSLIEMESRFSAPLLAEIPKALPVEATPLQLRLIAALRRLGYIETSSDGALALTRDGMLHIEGVVDAGPGFTLPIATRHFAGVTMMESDGGVEHAGFAWQWQPNSLGEQVIPAPARHDAIADLANANGRWSVQQFSSLDADPR